jgi:tetratricopeptide (TPR) repeat protein
VRPSLELADQLVSLDPLNPAIHSFQSLVFFYARRFEDSIASARHSLQLSPQRYVAYSRIGDSLIMLGRAKEAAAEYDRMPADDPWRLVGHAIVASKLGDEAASDHAVSELLDRFGQSWSYQVAEVHALGADPDAALAALERAWKIRDPGLLAVRIDPFLDPIRSDPRFGTFVAGLRLP